MEPKDKDEILGNDQEYQEWSNDHEKETREQLIKFYDLWEVE
jgi:hypothetical protein